LVPSNGKAVLRSTSESPPSTQQVEGRSVQPSRRVILEPAPGEERSQERFLRQLFRHRKISAHESQRSREAPVFGTIKTVERLVGGRAFRHGETPPPIH